MKNYNKIHNFREIIIGTLYLSGTVVTIIAVSFLFSQGFSIIRTFFLKSDGRWQWLWNSFAAWFSEGLKDNVISIFSILQNICTLIIYLGTGYSINKLLKDFFHLENPQKRGVLTIILTLFVIALFLIANDDIQIATMENGEMINGEY